MATTGFWPVKGNLKATIDYAENPDKTTDRKFLDDDLYNTLQYAQNDQKTDQKMYVSAINCPPQRAYEAMMDTKRRFGKLGGNVAYHGYQSFQVGEVTPEEAHQIGVETAQKMWGSEYEIVVTAHLNTERMILRTICRICPCATFALTRMTGTPGSCSPPIRRCSMPSTM